MYVFSSINKQIIHEKTLLLFKTDSLNCKESSSNDYTCQKCGLNERRFIKNPDTQLKGSEYCNVIAQLNNHILFKKSKNILEDEIIFNKKDYGYDSDSESD